MSLTAIVTNHDYGRYLRQCLTSATRFCDEVRVYDDGSTDDSLDIIAEFPDVKLTHREDATGDPVWGSDLGIKETTTSHLIFLDADNYLIRRPSETDYDYCYYNIFISDAEGFVHSVWDYKYIWPATGEQAIQRFIETCAMPFPWGGVWNMAFLRGKKWKRWPGTSMAADFRTAIEWAKDSPRFNHCDKPFMVFRQHDGQWSASPERIIMEREAAKLRERMCA